MDILRNKRYIRKKKCNQDIKKELKCSYLDILRNMQEIFKKINNLGYRKIKFVKKKQIVGIF